MGWIGPERPGKQAWQEITGEQKNNRVRFLFLKRSPWCLVDKRLRGVSCGGSGGPRRSPLARWWGCRKVAGQRQVALETLQMSGEGLVGMQWEVSRESGRLQGEQEGERGRDVRSQGQGTGLLVREVST